MNNKKEIDQNSEIVDLVSEIHQSILTPDRFMEILALWNEHVSVNKLVEQSTLDLLEMQLKNAVPLIEGSFKDIVNEDDLFNHLNDETRPSLLISNRNLIVGSNEAGRDLFNVKEGDEFDRSMMEETDQKKLSVILNSTAETKDGKDYDVVTITLATKGKNLKRSLVAVRNVRPTYGDANYILFSAIGIQLSGHARKLFQKTFSLTNTEMESIDLLVQGMGPKVISQLKDCREDTVKKQFKEIRAKTMCENSTALVCLVAGFSNISRTVVEENNASDTSRSFTNKAKQTYTMPIRNKLAKIKDYMLEYCEYGDENLRPILMQNLTITGFVLPPELIKQLNKRGYKLVVVFRPGYGMSSPLTKKYDYNLVAERIGEFVDFLKLDKYAMLVGTIGCLHGLALANQRKGDVVGLVSVASFLPLDEQVSQKALPKYQYTVQKHLKSNRYIAKYLLLGGYRLLLQYGTHSFLSKILKDSKADQTIINDADTLDILSVGLKASLAQGIDALIEDAALSGADWKYLVEEATLPIKFIHGDDDTMYKVPIVEQFCKTHNIPVDFISNTGHLLIYAKPKLIADIISNFYDEQDGWN